MFVFTGRADEVTLGQRVRVTGFVSEFQGQTQVDDEPGSRRLRHRTVAPTAVTLPQPSADYFERYEGMLVAFDQTLAVTETFQLGRFGQVVMSSDERLWQPTQLVEPGCAGTRHAGSQQPGPGHRRRRVAGPEPGPDPVRPRR